MSQILITGIFGLIGVTILGHILGCYHVIQEGNIGLYSRGGALVEGINEPGFHMMVPFITKLYQVQVTIQTDQVQNIPCGTASGVLIYFDKIEVVNRLKKELAWQTIKNYTVHYDQTWIFDKIHHEINQFCSKHTLHEVLVDHFDQLDDSLQSSLQQGCEKWAPGIEIISIRVTKPKIPLSIEENYIQTEAQKTQLLIVRQEQKVKEEESQIQKTIQRMEAETQSQISQITSQQLLIEQEGLKKIQELQDKIDYEQRKSQAEAEQYKNKKEIEINQRKLKQDFQNLQAVNNLKNVKKVYYGESIEHYLRENNILNNAKLIKNNKENKEGKQ